MEPIMNLAEVGKFRRAFARMIGQDYCPVCGANVIAEVVNTEEFDGEKMFTMECRNPTCKGQYIFGDLFYTKKEAVEYWKRQRRIFELICSVTCRCNSCGGTVKTVEVFKNMANPLNLTCANCGKSVNEKTLQKCIEVWNEKQDWFWDKPFRAKYENFASWLFNKELDELVELFNKRSR